MLLNELSYNEKQVFWRLANALSMADGKITQREKELLEKYPSELGEDFSVVQGHTVIAINPLNGITSLNTTFVFILHFFYRYIQSLKFIMKKLKDPSFRLSSSAVLIVIEVVV